MSKYYNADVLAYPKTLHFKITKRKYIQAFRVKSYIRKIKIRNKRKFIKQYKIKFNPVLRNDLPFIWYGNMIKGD